MNDPHYVNRIAQIGNICAQWSSLEYHAAMAIWNLADIHDMEVGKILTASLDLKQRVGMAFALAHTVNAPFTFKKAIKSLQTALRNEDLIELRNQAVHGIHFTVDEPAAIGVEMHRGKGGRGRRVQYDKDLVALGQRLTELRNEFAAIVMQQIENKKAEMKSHADALAMLVNSAATNSRAEDSGP